MNNLFAVADKNVVVTGGSSGIGLQLVKLFAAHGARVTSVATSHTQAVCDEINAVQAAHRILLVSADLTEEAGVEQAFAQIDGAHGAPEVLFNNAGISQRKRFLDVKRVDWNSVMEINLKAMFFVAQEAAGRMARDGVHGSIINMSSILSNKAMTGTAVYSSAKSGVNQMTKALAFELAPHGIRVNAIAPGWFETRMTARFLNEGAKAYLKSVNPLKRLGQPGDIDGAALLLASDAGRYITGTVITIDGGQSLSG